MGQFTDPPCWIEDGRGRHPPHSLSSKNNDNFALNVLCSFAIIPSRSKWYDQKRCAFSWREDKRERAKDCNPFQSFLCTLCGSNSIYYKYRKFVGLRGHLGLSIQKYHEFILLRRILRRLPFYKRVSAVWSH